MIRPSALVHALSAAAPRFAPRDRRKKVRLLERLAERSIGQPALLLRLHEALCFLQAYPDDARVLALVDGALADFAARVERLGGAARSRLYDSGIVGTSLDYPFGLPMTRWLVTRFPRDADVAWEKYEGADQLDEALSLLITPVEEDAFSYGGLGWREWLRVAKAGRRMTDLRLLLDLLERANLPEETRGWVFERLELPIRVQLRQTGVSRTLAKLPWERPFYHRAGLRRTPMDLTRGAGASLSVRHKVPRPLAESLIEAARAAMATRFRELHPFSYANPEDVLVVDAGRGVRIALIGILPRFRFPLEGYYAFFALKNGVPVGYGGGCELFGNLDLATNIFPSFRQGESAYVFGQVFRAFRRVLGMRTVVVDPYQIGHKNPEALRTGAFYFYSRLGFRPRDPAVLALLGEELEKIARDRSYRSPIAVLRRLARAELYLGLPGGNPEPEKRLTASQVAALVSRRIAQEFGGDRDRAVRRSAARAGRALGVRGWRGWAEDERRAFEHLSVVAGLIPDLPRWPVADRRALVAVFRAKGGRRELPYIRLLNRHRLFRQRLEALVAAARPRLDRGGRGA